MALTRSPRILRMQTLPTASLAWLGFIIYQRSDNRYYQINDAGTAWTGVNGIDLPIDDTDVNNTSGWLGGTVRTVTSYIASFWTFDSSFYIDDSSWFFLKTKERIKNI